MRHYNADPTHRITLQFYGFDSPTEMTGNDSPRQVLHLMLDYLASVGPGRDQMYRQRIEQLIGPDAAWENPAAMMDPEQSIGLSPNATALRIETEELIAELQARRPELVAKSDERRYVEAMHAASVARQFLNYHAALARASRDRLARLLGMRDALMADNLVYMVSRERGRGKVLAFAHNSHLRRGKAEWHLGGEVYTWWPAGAHLAEMLGPRYAVIGSAVGESLANGIGKPESGTLESRLTAVPGPVRFLPTHRGQGLPASAIAALPTRSGSVKNPTYFALTPQSLIDFDWLVVLDSTAYSRGKMQGNRFTQSISRSGNQDDLFCQWSHMVLPVSRITLQSEAKLGQPPLISCPGFHTVRSVPGPSSHPPAACLAPGRRRAAESAAHSLALLPLFPPYGSASA